MYKSLQQTYLPEKDSVASVGNHSRTLLLNIAFEVLAMLVSQQKDTEDLQVRKKAIKLS